MRGLEEQSYSYCVVSSTGRDSPDARLSSQKQECTFLNLYKKETMKYKIKLGTFGQLMQKSGDLLD
ncbi:hypothetical protein [Azospirillum sp.]|uniref:hypothetical protein n=1 Tax=Azospirillum sp. TaxID=34012 RepID=UPI002D22A13D|nr:hypothetical protein [Azospirillum sp.]HYF90091.1 hypothetical protein [Azospirillum sp.]